MRSREVLVLGLVTDQVLEVRIVIQFTPDFAVVLRAGQVCDILGAPGHYLLLKWYQ